MTSWGTVVVHNFIKETPQTVIPSDFWDRIDYDLYHELLYTQQAGSCHPAHGESSHHHVPAQGGGPRKASGQGKTGMPLELFNANQLEKSATAVTLRFVLKMLSPLVSISNSTLQRRGVIRNREAQDESRGTILSHQSDGRLR